MPVVSPRDHDQSAEVNSRSFAKTAKASEDETPRWRPLRKGVAAMERRAEVGQAANNRLVESLATVAETTTLGELLRRLGRPVIREGPTSRPRLESVDRCGW